eukprot:6713906-Pyramimonas_sp.AAC.1
MHGGQSWGRSPREGRAARQSLAPRLSPPASSEARGGSLALGWHGMAQVKEHRRECYQECYRRTAREPRRKGQRG